MIVVSEKSIDKAFDIINDLNDDEVQNYIDNSAKEQPNIIGFAMASGQDLSPDLSEDLLYYTLIIWEAFKAEAGKIPQISEDLLEEKIEAYYSKLEEIEASQDMEAAALEEINSNNQPALMSFIVTQIMDERDEEEEKNLSEAAISEEGSFFAALQIIADTFDAALNPESKLRIV
ncbi:MAG: hypothetical protein A2275_13995 [Bacteroidetes bacterium RIFOXYA12_FULL_35_11]|nr:MAG: hypothetical protein A2X01_03470 [Bacteroidetes bacterium GWF2_35_48]OFY73523.1 MAG: hypothetical protein A2275_13995 [Bacteroidetes bacterium RIFOXYA12_FULL_35_11]HBX51067.1 hypothetical protein [Bacteroidales bacterium]